MEERSKLQVLVKRLDKIFRGESAGGLGLVDAESVHIRSLITEALSKSESTVSKAICNVPNGFHVKVSSDSPGLSAWDSSDRA